MGLVLAVLAAAAWGGSDFLAGRATRAAGELAVTAVAQLAGLCLAACVVPFAGGHPGAAGLGWGALAGAADTIGLAALYRALAIGPMSVVAPATAGLAAVIPVAAGAALGQRPTGLALGGVILAMAAIIVLSSGGDEDGTRAGRLRRSGPAALIAGAAFGGFYIALSRAGAHAGLWPVASARATAVLLLWPLLLVRRRRVTGCAAALGPAVAAGLLDTGAAAATLLALRSQSLPVVAVLSSLYPVVTVALAVAVERERLTASRLGGLAAAAAAVTLIAAGGAPRSPARPTPAGTTAHLPSGRHAGP